MVEDIVAKAKALKVTVHEYFLATISVAIYKVTEGRETNRVNFVQPVSVGESSQNLHKFTPGNSFCPTFCTIGARPTLDEAIKEARMSIARYRDPNYMAFWIFT